MKKLTVQVTSPSHSGESRNLEVVIPALAKRRGGSAVLFGGKAGI